MPINTDIKLRPLKTSDADQLAILANNKKIWINLRHQTPFPYTISHSKEFINSVLNEIPLLHYAIETQNQLAGVIGLNTKSKEPDCSAETGFWLGEPFWNKGVATSALLQMTEMAFEIMHFKRLYAGIFEWNKAGMRVLEKCGFQWEGISYNTACKNNRCVDEYWYGLMKQ